MLRKFGILYAPDFVMNTGGIVEIHHQRSGSADQSREHVTKIADTLTQIFASSDEQETSTVDVAENLANEKFESATNTIGAVYEKRNDA